MHQVRYASLYEVILKQAFVIILIIYILDSVHFVEDCSTMHENP